MREATQAVHTEFRISHWHQGHCGKTGIHHLHADVGDDRSLTSPSNWQHLYMLEEAGAVTIDRVAHQLEAGSILCLPTATACHLRLAPGATAILVSVDEVLFQTRVLNLLPGNQDRDSSFWRSYYRTRILPHSTGPKNRHQRLRTGAELAALARHMGKGGDPAIVGAALVILMGGLKRQHPPPANQLVSPAGSAVNSNIVIEFRVLIERHFAQHLKIGQYADMLGITPRTLLRACQAITGRRPISLIHDRIVLEATRALGYTSRTISDIGYSLGFEDVGYFSRFIKFHSGRSPTGLRRQQTSYPPPS